ncbi:hypothetical protein [uncultured Ruminococcus sp.]|uniref:hypothetical protein n=1 Tax=uncultured Ruminococcus sp. TaxID=165186 RepID=UPI0025F17C14|nr:hypothetical protein [uncultured Ruminococcus sp.]
MLGSFGQSAGIPMICKRITSRNAPNYQHSRLKNVEKTAHSGIHNIGRMTAPQNSPALSALTSKNVEKQAMRGSFGQSAGSPMICKRITFPNSPYLSTFAAEKC